MTYIPPAVFTSKFTCPHCAAIAKQSWQARARDFNQYHPRETNEIRVATCDHCGNYTLWHHETMVYPDRGNAPPPNPDMPDDVNRYYEEAAAIAAKSPRAAAGLLRLAVQLLCKELGEAGQNINDDIGALVKKGLPSTVQQSLDIVRVTGNNAVHPGQIDTDDEQVVAALFSLLNVIVEYMISLPNRVGTLYGALPAGALDQIKKRDTKKT
jgi:Domain of unknown function (DUF4145)